MSIIEGAQCNVCNNGVLEEKTGSATSKIAGQKYYVCGNWQWHKDHPDQKSPFFMASDTQKINKYLGLANKREAAAPTVPPAFKKPCAKPAADAPDVNHVIVATHAKIQQLGARLEYLISLQESKNSKAEEADDEQPEDA